MNEIEIELEVTKLMQELQKVSINLEDIISSYTFIIEEATRKIEEISQPYSERSEILQNKIKELILLREKSLKCGSGNITYRKGAVRRSWDLDKLDTICEIDPYVRVSIWDYRKENVGEPSVTIKIDTKGISTVNL